MLNGSHVIKGRWKIVKKIGQGAFGEIYQAKNILTNEMVAIKVERVDSKKQVLKLEVAVLKKLQDCNYVCRFITCGRFSDYNYMVMELLGENLSEWRRKQPEGKFSLGTTIKLGQQMLRAIEAVHQLGYLHRDIKPSNFAMGLVNKRKTAFLIDFGLARRYVTQTGEVRPARESAGFRGTARYASINSHLSKDLGRRDDLWSLFYVLIEFAKGVLPWRKLKEKDQIGEMKIATDRAELIKDLPKEFGVFMDHLLKLDYMDKPDYKYLESLLVDMYHQLPSDRISATEVADLENSSNSGGTGNEPNKASTSTVAINTTVNSKDPTTIAPPSTSNPKYKQSHQRNLSASALNSSRQMRFSSDTNRSHDQGDQHIISSNGTPVDDSKESKQAKENSEKKMVVPNSPSLLRQTTDNQFYRNAIGSNSFKSLAELGGEFKSPIAMINPKQGYVSSNMDENESFPKQHRRCSSLPINLGNTTVAQGEEMNTSQESKDKELAKNTLQPNQTQLNSQPNHINNHPQQKKTHISLPFFKTKLSNHSMKGLKSSEDEEAKGVSPNAVLLNMGNNSLPKVEQVGSHDSTNVEVMEVRDGDKQKFKKKFGRNSKSNSNDHLRSNQNSLREKTDKQGKCCSTNKQCIIS